MVNKQENLFDLLPCINERIVTETGEDGLIWILFPRFRSAFLNRWLTPRGKSPHIRIQLEEHGSAVWRMIDGQRSVRDIALALAEHFQHEQGYEHRVAIFIKQLRKDDYIRLNKVAGNSYCPFRPKRIF